jgi:hypothetical protein
VLATARLGLNAENAYGESSLPVPALEEDRPWRGQIIGKISDFGGILRDRTADEVWQPSANVQKCSQKNTRAQL